MGPPTGSAFLDHRRRFGGYYFGADVAVHDAADQPDLFRDRPAFFGDQRRIGSHAIEDAPACALLELIEIRGVEEKLHVFSLTSRLAGNRSAMVNI